MANPAVSTRNGSFEPQRINKQQTSRSDFIEDMPSLDARGMTLREIQSQYGADFSPTQIPSVKEAVMAEAKYWQARRHDAP